MGYVQLTVVEGNSFILANKVNAVNFPFGEMDILYGLVVGDVRVKGLLHLV